MHQIGASSKSITYDMEAANTSPHNNRTSLLQELPPWALPTIAFLIWACIHPYSAIPAGIAGYVFHRIGEANRIAREEAARAASFANICGPVVVGSIHPGETVDEVANRVADFKHRIKISGNLYADKIPVIAHPYAPMIYGYGQLTAAWNIYLREVGERQHQENIKWAESGCPKELRTLFLSQVMPSAPQPIEN